MNPIFPSMPAGMVDTDVILRLLAEHGAELCAIVLIASQSPLVDRSAFLRQAVERPDGDLDEILATLDVMLLTLDLLIAEPPEMEAAA